MILNATNLDSKRLEGGGRVDETTKTIYDGVSISYTATNGGVFCINFAKDNVSYTIELLVNNIVVRNGYWNYGYPSGGVITGCWEVAVKKGDVIVVQTNALQTSPFWCRCYLSKYRN